MLLRTDNFAPTKTPKCTHGDPCRGSCIDPRETCRVEMSPLMQAQVQGLKNSLLNAVPGGREINTARDVISNFKQVREAGSLGQQAAYFGAVLLGASAIGYAKYREKYREGLDNSAEVAMRRAKGMANSVPDIGGKKNIIFTVDSSLSKGDKGRGNGLAAELVQDPEFAAKYHITSIKQNAHETPKDMEGLNKRDRLIAEAMTPIKQALMNARNGQSDAAVELASQVLAYQQKHGERTESYVEETVSYGTVYKQTKQRAIPTGLQINLLGHGDGGMVAHEAMEILKKVPGTGDLTKSINVVGLNTPDAGLTDTIGRVKTIASRNSPLSLLPMKGKITMDAPDGNGGRAMIRKKEVRQFIDGHFGGNPAAIPKAPVAQASSKDPEPEKKWVNPPSLNDRPTAPTQTALSLTKTTSLGSSGSEPEGDDQRIAISRARMVAFSNELVNKGTAEATVAAIRKNYPALTDKELEQAIKIHKAPRVIKEMLKTGQIQPKPAERIAELMKGSRDKGDFEDFLVDEEKTTAFDFNRPDHVDKAIERFKEYKAKFNYRDDAIALLKKRLDALELRVA
jgi:hypothetical protein